MDKIQSAFGIARAELIAVIVLGGGLLAGLMIKYFIAENRDVYYSNSAEISHLLDSLAEAEVPSYTGTTDTLAIAEFKEKSRDTFVADTKFSSENPPHTKIDLNTATREELMKLPGIGPKTAEDIMTYRQNIPFRKIEDLMDIKGIGEKKFEKVKSFINVR
jgi:comEA protein